MIITTPTSALFLVFRGKEVALVRDDINTGEWDMPSFILNGNPSERYVEMTIAKYFRRAIVTSVEAVDAELLGEDRFQLSNSQLYYCVVREVVSKTGYVFYVNKSSKLPNSMSIRARAIISSPYVQSRLA